MARCMIFVDGENLVFPYQDLLKAGREAEADIFHEPDAYVWRRSWAGLIEDHEILRASYYTYIVGGDEKQNAVRAALRALGVSARTRSTAKSLTPVVLKKSKQQQKIRGVDINLTIDVLSNVYQNHTDAIFLMSGDSDFLPLIHEVHRHGKHVFVAAFSGTYTEEMKIVPDRFYELDRYTFAQ